MIETVKKPFFLNSDFAAARKRPGISAFMRLHNEEDFAAAAINSILPFFDEIIVVYNVQALSQGRIPFSALDDP